MAGYVLRRLLQSLVVLWGVSVAVFALIHLVPGDPIRTALGTRYTEEAAAALRERAGLDQPLLVQYVDWALSAVRGDLGVSFRSGRPVTELILERLPATLSLAFGALVVALLLAFPLGLIAARRRGTAADHASSTLSQVGISIPDFWLAILLILLFSLNLAWLPSGGYVPLTEDPVQWLVHLVLPAVTVGVVSGAVLTRFVRASVVEAQEQEHTRFAHAKGLREGVVLRRHVVRNALVPIVTVVGVQLAYLLSGVVVVEAVFSWQGLGELALRAVEQRDYPLLQGAVLLFALFFLLVNLVVDLLYAYLDPRISYS